ncbi:MAG: hypothetical protein V8S14_02360 [Lachnospiraceae bacterium]
MERERNARRRKNEEKVTCAENLRTGCSDKRTCDYYNDGPAFVSYTED